MKLLTLSIPDNLEIPEQEILETLITKLYEMGKLSQGQAANWLGISKREFIDLLGKYKVSVFNAPIDELKQDLANA
ncbi:MAG: UPF0175 family protein [Microscillaceae bacterium]|jgi:predicted HTH domain antitoxin|nr:UPF0175 family protein [Microscillaceae bacterium]